jgi:hypothetical protein
LIEFKLKRAAAIRTQGDILSLISNPDGVELIGSVGHGLRKALSCPYLVFGKRSVISYRSFTRGDIVTPVPVIAFFDFGYCATNELSIYFDENLLTEGEFFHT